MAGTSTYTRVAHVHFTSQGGRVVLIPEASHYLTPLSYFLPNVKYLYECALQIVISSTHLETHLPLRSLKWDQANISIW